jgi:hypothetical protein
MHSVQRLAVTAAAAALGFVGLVGMAGAADIGPGGPYYPPGPYAESYPPPPPRYERRRQVEVEDDGECRTYVRRSVDDYGREHVRRVEDCAEGRAPRWGDADDDDEDTYTAVPPPYGAPRPPGALGGAYDD